MDLSRAFHGEQTMHNETESTLLIDQEFYL